MKLDEIGNWSEVKLDIIKEYANAFTKIMRNKEWCKGYVYIDAFAGPGVHISRKTGEFVLGSPLNALEIDYPFTEYHYIDIDKKKMEILRGLIGDRTDITIYQEDCNEILTEKILPYCSEFEITEDSAWKGKTLSEIGLGHEYDLTVLRILKEPGYHVSPRANTVLQKNDKVLVEGNRDDLVALQEQDTIKYTGEFKGKKDVSQELSLAEVIVLPGSPLIGRTLWGLSFRQRYGLQVLGINRKGETIRQRISRTRLKVGDQLLIQGDPATIQGLSNNNNFRVVSAKLDIMPETKRAPIALAISDVRK